MANSGVNVKMGVTGVAQFKQNINTAKQSLKTLDAQLALNEKQYRASGDAEAYMEEKSQLLQLKLAEQKAVIANTERALKEMAENGVDKGSKAFQDMQRQLLNAKGDLIDTQTQMQNVADVSEDAGNNVDSMNRQLQDIGKGISFQNVTEGLGKINDSISQVIRKAGRMGRALLNNVRGSAAWADELKTRSTTWGVSTDELQRMDQVAERVDTDTDTILTAKDKMVKNVNAGSKETMGAFAAINKAINPKDFIHSKEGIEDLFWEAGEYISNLTDEGEKEAYAMSIFGKSWRDLVPLFSTGREEYNRLMEAQHVVSEKQLDSLGEFDDSMQNLTNEWETFKNTIMGTLAEGLNPLLQTLGTFMGKLNEYLASEEGQAMLQRLSDLIAGLFEDLTKIDPDKVMEGITGAFKKVEEALTWISEHKDDVITALEAIGIAFGALKITEIALGIGKIVGGFKNLLGLGAKKAAETAGTSAASSAASSAPTAAAAGGGLKATLANWFGAGSSFSMAGGLGVAGPLAAFLAAGYAGWKLVDANLHDENLNAIYGNGGGVEDNGLITRMSPESWKAAKEYFDLTQNKSATPDQLTNARERLFGSLGSDGIVNTEQAVSLIENAFDSWARGWSEDGLVDAIGRKFPGFFDTETRNTDFIDDLVNEQSQTRRTNDDMAKAADGMMSLPKLIEAAVADGMANVRIYIDGQQAGTVLAPYVGQAQGGAVSLMVTQ